MIKKFLYIAIFILNFNNLLAIESKIIYKIQNEIITNIDIKNEYNFLSALNDNLQSLGKEKIFNIAKDSIIREKIKQVELIKNSIDVNVDIAYQDELMENIYHKLDLKSVDDFKEYLKKYDLNFKTVEKKVKIDALWNELIIKKYDAKVEINLEKIKNKIKNKKSVTKSYLLSEIVFEIQNKKEIKKKYSEIQKSVNEVGFKNTVSIYSISDSRKTGGNIGWVNASSLNNKIRDNILSLNINDLSSPFIMPGGVLILKIDDIKEEPKKINFDLELEKVIRYERNKQLNQYSQIYFNKTKKNLGFNE
jgi:peptidyl-prolyl cis-trans isomerase SurA